MSHSVLVFDGVCVLCNGWVRFVLRHDAQERYRFAALQSEAGRRLLSAHGMDPDDPLSFLLIENGRGYTDSDAIVRVLRGFGGLWRAPAAAMRVVPRFILDPAYRWIARNRYRLFGRREQCVIPHPHEAHRFIQ